ncbi:MAG TPA: prenyltransferase/squalene oxidase repeat-containing protein [Actinomycetes bacterium]|nr:prenyltransferase/squalene oxidase repeat-containing protein [Actinomycetes bacterium]
MPNPVVSPVARFLTSAAVLGVALVITMAAGVQLSLPAAAGGPATTATTSVHPALVGLYGSQTPQYDGVYRQGLSVIALDSSGRTVDPSAIRWLLRQQCDNGRWTSFRPDLSKRCGAADSNATAMAVMALRAVGKRAAATQGLAWLIDHQQVGGGWEYSPGWGPDANSTGLVVQSLIAMKVDPATVQNGGSPLDFLASVQLGCEAKVRQRGALDYQLESPLVRNDYATAQATQALAGSKLPVAQKAGSTELPTMPCGTTTTTTTTTASTAAQFAAGYLGRRLAASGGTIPSTFGGGADYGSTANAVLSLVAAGYGSSEVTTAMTQLELGARGFVLDGSNNVLPAAAALVSITENATGGDPTDVDGLNLLRRLTRSITKPA